MSDKIYIVWNAVRTEGFVTVDKHLAYEARKGSDTNCFDADGRRSDLAVKFCELTGDEDCITQVLDPACITPLSADELMLTLYVLNVYTENVGGVEKADDRGVYRRILALQQKVKMAVGRAPNRTQFGPNQFAPARAVGGHRAPCERSSNDAD